MKIVEKRKLELLEHITNKYPTSLFSRMIKDLINEISPNSFIISFSCQAWQLIPNQKIMLEDVIDLSLLAQLSYNGLVHYLDLPDMYHHQTSLQKTYSLGQIQLGLIWLLSFVLQQSHQVFQKYNKLVDDNYFDQLSTYFEKIILNYSFQEVSKLDPDTKIRRQQLTKLLQKWDTLFYTNLLVFYYCLFVVFV